MDMHTTTGACCVDRFTTCLAAISVSSRVDSSLTTVCGAKKQHHLVPIFFRVQFGLKSSCSLRSTIFDYIVEHLKDASGNQFTGKCKYLLSIPILSTFQTYRNCR